MSTSWRIFYGDCKSRLSALARSCFLGRERWKQKYLEAVERFGEEVKGLEKCISSQRESIADLQAELDDANKRIEESQRQIIELKLEGVRLPEDPHVPGQHYGARTIELSVNLARKVGLRRSVVAMKEFFRWLGVKKEIPTYQAVRTWMQRVGLNRMERVPQKADRVWIADQSNQIGQEKCLMVLGIQKSKLPKVGTALKHKDVEVLGMYPGKNWHRENVQTAYQQISGRCGCPEAVLTDGAVELREPVETLKNNGKHSRSFRDMKHFLANRVEALLTQDNRFKCFQTHLNRVRSSMQQTELAHLAPPSLRKKARFMNLGPILKWGEMALWQWDHPESDGRKGISADRMKEKLGWLRKYRADIHQWHELQSVTEVILSVTNNDGLTHGTKEQLKKELNCLHTTAKTKVYIEQALAFVGEQESKLKPNERIPFSTEILESSFGLFKGLEQYHARSGFTQLVLTFPCMLRPTTSKEVIHALKKTKIADVKKWIEKHLPVSVDSRRLKAHRETRPTKSKAVKLNRATALAATG